MEKVRIRVKSLLRMKLELLEYPELSSKNRFARKAIELVKNRFPKVLTLLSREAALSSIRNHEIELLYHGNKDQDHVIQAFGIWLGEQRLKRLLLIAGEVILLPPAVLLSVLPGPNIFLYVLFVILYFHFKSYLSLRSVKTKDLKITVLPDEDPSKI